jgi:hypothetical protein
MSLLTSVEFWAGVALGAIFWYGVMSAALRGRRR